MAKELKSVDELLAQVVKHRDDEHDAATITSMVGCIRRNYKGKTPGEVQDLVSSTGMYTWLQDYYGSRTMMIKMVKALAAEIDLRWSEGKTFY